MTTQKGFTLIETLIYITLFTIVIGGGMVAAYQIIQAANASQNYIALQEEANFLLRKIDWTMSGVTQICSISTNKLAVTKSYPTVCTIYSESILTITQNSITLASGNGISVPLNSSSIIISDASFISAGNGVTAKFTMTSSIDGRNISESFSTTKYLRQ